VTGGSAGSDLDPMAPLREAAAVVRGVSELVPRVGILLGTGLGALAEGVEAEAAVPYQEIPHFPRSTVDTHEGRLVLGRLEGVPVAVMQGRHHRYEGYSFREIAFPVRVLKLLGIEALVVTGACGGMNPLMGLGDLVVLDDHINLMGDGPLTGPNLDDLGPRFPDMSEPYDRELQEAAVRAGLAHGLRLHRGVYAAVVGPQLETRAEYRMLRSLGADVVGMSTVPEVITARHMGVRVLGISIITDLCLPDALEPVDVPAIIRTAAGAEPHLTRIVRDVVADL
jgi:purine-nucleoside phosphorylase